MPSPRNRRSGGARVAWLATLAVWLGACGVQPETDLIGCWREVEWTYEKVDDVTQARIRWNDGVRVRQYPDREVLRHEAERWEFKPRGELSMRLLDGATRRAKWRLKGRGHVLAIHHADERFEVYDIKELNRDELILNFDMGMEVRGIARLEFERVSCGGEQRDNESTLARELSASELKASNDL